MGCHFTLIILSPEHPTLFWCYGDIWTMDRSDKMILILSLPFLLKRAEAITKIGIPSTVTIGGKPFQVGKTARLRVGVIGEYEKP